MQYIICKTGLLKKHRIKPNNNKANPKIKSDAPIIVKSVLVVNAYTVKAAVIPNVINAAIKTNSDLD